MSEAGNGFRVLVLARIGRDSELLCSTLRRNGHDCETMSTADELLTAAIRGAGAAVVTEESLHELSESWVQRLQLQPAWSDFPFIVLTSPEASDALVSKRAALSRALGNVALLERPLRGETFLSAVKAALRARSRQYQISDYIKRQVDSQEALRKTEKLAVAGRLAASIAHEINNPLAAVTNLLYLVQTSESLDDVKKYNALAQDEIRRISDIANQTLRFYRSPAAEECTDAAELIESAVVLFRAKLRAQNIKINRDFAKNCRFVCSVGELRQVLVNLVANAIDAMPSGGSLLLRTSCQSHPSDSRPGVRITVADSGPGIPPSAKRRLFEPFFTTKGTTGTGLGLWLAKDILERVHGHIRFHNHSRPHGAVFSFWVPANLPANASIVHECMVSSQK